MQAPFVNPLVSVVIPTYNRAQYIGETIQSVLDQTYPHWEMVIVDDGSTDDTESVVATFKDDRIKYFRREPTRNIGKVRDFGIRQSVGTYIAFLDSDDLWRSDKLAFQLQLFNEHFGLSFVLSNGDEFGENFIQTPDYETLFIGSLFLPILDGEHFCFYVPTFIFKREAFDAVGWTVEFDSSIPDVEFFFRLSHRFHGAFTNERLVRIRKHLQNHSSQSDFNAYFDTLPMLKRFYQEGMISQSLFKKLTAECYYKIGMLHLRKKQPNASRAFYNYMLLKPLHYKGYVRLAQSALRRLLQ